MPAPADLERLLRGASLRVTRPRLAVLAAVHGHPHADTGSISGLVREDLGEVSQQAVYDVLAALTAACLVRRIHPPGSVARYEARVGDNHHHVVCRSCGAIADVDCAVGSAPCLTPSDHSGYVIDEAEVIFWGVCRGCSTAPLPEPEPESTDPRGESQPLITAQRRSAALEGVHPAGAPPIDTGPRQQQGFIHDHRWIQAESNP